MVGPGAVRVAWQSGGGAGLALDANLKAEPQDGFAPAGGRVVWLEGKAEGATLAPWSVRWTVTGPA